VRASSEPERALAGALLVLVAALAGSAAVLLTLVSSVLVFALPGDAQGTALSMLLTFIALVATAIISIGLAAFVLAGRHSQEALAIATGLALVVAGTLERVGGSVPWLVLAIAGVTGGALLIGIVRRRRA
jgi:hypothetical protein